MASRDRGTTHDLIWAWFDFHDPAQRCLAQEFHRLRHQAIAETGGALVNMFTFDQAIAAGDPRAQGRAEYCLAGSIDGQVVATGKLARTLHDDTTTGWTQVCVHPDHRRRRLGRQALDLIEQQAESLQITTLTGWEVTAEGRPNLAGAFAPSVGFRVVDLYREQALTLARLPRYDNPTAKAHRAGSSVESPPSPSLPSGYQISVFVDQLPPDIAALAQLHRAMSIDAPTDLPLAESTIDADRVRADFDAIKRSGCTQLLAIATHERDGYVGFTEASFSPASTIATTGSTLVARPHRGRRLAAALKEALHTQLAVSFPMIDQVVTEVHEQNTAMLRTNEQMGFREVGTAITLHKPLMSTR